MPTPISQIPTIATDYSLYSAPAIPGMQWGSGAPVVYPHQNLWATKKAKWTIAAPATVDANATYTVVVNGESVSVSSGAATTQAQLATLLLNALRSRMALTIGHNINLSGSTVTIESLNPGAPITVTCPTNASTTNDLTLTEVAASGDEAIIPFGRFVGRKFDYPTRAASLISSNSGTYAAGQNGFLPLGITSTTQASMRIGRGLDAVGGYSPKDTMNVWAGKGNSQGIWVECTPENDITIGDSLGTTNLFIATTSGNEGKLTKDDTTYAGLALGGKVEVLEPSQSVINNWVVALISFDKLSG